MANEIYRSYLLVIKGPKGELTQIDFSKIRNIHIEKNNCYKLEHIDAFTTIFKSAEEMKIHLFQENFIDRKTMEKSEIKVYPVKREKVERIINGKAKKIEEIKYAEEPLEYAIPYQKYKGFFETDGEVIDYIYNKLDDFDFIEALTTKYLTRSNYSDGHISVLKYRIDEMEEQLRRYPNPKLEGTKKGMFLQLKDCQESNAVLKSMLYFANLKRKGEELDNESLESAYNAVREFVLREKYTVTNTTDGLNDRRILEFKKNKDGSRTTSYLKFRNLITFIIYYNEEQELKQEQEKKKQEELQDEGKQMTLWDLPGFKK